MLLSAKVTFADLTCTSLINVNLGNSVTSIGSSAFNGCTSLTYNEYENGYYLGNNSNKYVVLVDVIDITTTSFTINSNSKIIYSQAFYNCTSLTNITIPEGIFSIGMMAFYNCKALKIVTIPDGVTSIGENTFLDCNSLETVYYCGTKGEWAAITFDNDYSDPTCNVATLYYYSESEPDYTDGYNYWRYVDGEIVVWTEE